VSSLRDWLFDVFENITDFLRSFKILYMLLYVSIFIEFSGCAVIHHYSPYIGQVVDAESGKPIEGAIVLAVY